MTNVRYFRNLEEAAAAGYTGNIHRRMTEVAVKRREALEEAAEAEREITKLHKPRRKKARRDR